MDADPPVPFTMGRGLNQFQIRCAECHGDWAEGTENGPTLIHPYYRPDHHSDAAFYRAMRQGVKAHHWKFGDMPPVPDVQNKDMQQITAFVRWLQQYKGLF